MKSWKLNCGLSDQCCIFLNAFSNTCNKNHILAAIESWKKWASRDGRHLRFRSSRALLCYSTSGWNEWNAIKGAICKLVCLLLQHIQPVFTLTVVYSPVCKKCSHVSIWLHLQESRVVESKASVNSCLCWSFSSTEVNQLVLVSSLCSSLPRRPLVL